MKKMLMLMLAAGFISVTARAEVGPKKDGVRCEQVLAQISETLKKNRPQAEPSTTGTAPTPANAGTAQ